MVEKTALEGPVHRLLPGLLLTLELFWLLRWLYPTNPLFTDAEYFLDQVQNGLVVGAVFGTMAVGLTLIYSVQGIISFAHGQLFMFGGVVAYLLLTRVWAVNGLVVIPVVGLLCLVLGLLLEWALLYSPPLRDHRTAGRVPRSSSPSGSGSSSSTAWSASWGAPRASAPPLHRPAPLGPG